MEKIGKEYNGLPVFRLEIDENGNTGVAAIALVDNPATEVNWMTFSKQIKFKTIEEKRNITAPIMTANMPIFRFDETMGEYYVIFEPAQIELMAKKYFKTNKIASVNEMHNSNKSVEGVYLIESWLVTDPQNDKSTALGFNVTPGTWMGTYHIESEQYWNEKIKSGEFKGFSLEGDFNMTFSKIQETPTEKTEEDIINEMKNIIKNGTEEGEKIIEDLKNLIQNGTK